MRRFLTGATALAASFAVWAACSPIDAEDNSEVKPAGELAEIKVTSAKIVTVDYNPSEVTITYSITGEGTGLVPEVTVSDDGMQAGEITDESAVISIPENQSDQDRTMTVTLSFPEARDVYVNILQGSNPYYRPNAKQSFEIVVSGIKYNEAGLSVRPTYTDTYYYIGLMPVEAYGGFKSDEEIVAAAKKSLDRDIESWNQSLGHLGVSCSYKDFLQVGYYNAYMNELYPDTEYYVMVFDMSLSGTSSGKIFKEKFKTLPVPASSDDFAISVDGGVVSVVPKDMSVEYVLDVVEESTWDYYGGDPLANAQDFLEWVFDEGYSVTRWMHKGTASVNYGAESNFTPGSYVAYAFGYDAKKGEITTDISYLHFRYEGTSAGAAALCRPVYSAEAASAKCRAGFTDRSKQRLR